MPKRRNGLIAGLLGGAALLMATATPAAGSAGPVDRVFPGGGISQLAINDGPTFGSFVNVFYEYEGCGKPENETACTWRVDVGLAPDGFELCPWSVEPAIWSSGEQTANGTAASGPQTFALRGSPGQLLCVVTHHTSSREGSGGKFKSKWSAVLDSVLMGPELISPIEARERQIIRASTPAQVAPPPHPPAFTVSPNCRTAKIGSVTHIFRFRQMGCWKARNLAAMAHMSGIAPNGYHCAPKNGGGKRCWRRGQPKKYVEWRPI